MERPAVNGLPENDLPPDMSDALQAGALLRLISAGTAAVTGADFFHSLVSTLAQALQVHSAFITECTDASHRRVRTLAFLANNRFEDEFEYDLNGTACEGVVAGSVCYYSTQVHALFAKEKGVESYMGLPIHNSQGEILGHLAISDTNPMPAEMPIHWKEILQIFAARAGAELDRLHAMEALQQAKEELEIRVRERTAELRASEEAYRDLYEEAPNIYLSTGSDSLIRKANKRAAEIFGYPLPELIGRPIFDLVADHPNGRPKARVLFHRFLAGEAIEGEEVEFQDTNGRRICGSVSIRPIHSETGEVDASRSIIVDITARKLAEEAQERLIIELDAFAHTVAHDLKNPLTGILANAELLQTSWAGPAERRQAVNRIEGNGRKMANIIKELLTLAQLRQIEDLVLHPLDMERILDEALQRLTHVIDIEAAEIILPSAWPAALGYAPWVEEVWANFLSNGLKYGGEPPRLVLGADKLTDGMVRFWVRDNGRGLTVEQQAQLFVPFTRLNQAKAAGHGLGLSIVHRIIERLGGSVGVESQIDQGSLFYFTLPAAS